MFLILDFTKTASLAILHNNSFIIKKLKPKNNISEILIFEIDKFSNGTKQLIAFLENSKSKVIAGGGETLFAINKFSDTSKFHYVSTAGGAFLEYLSGNKLPSIEALRLK